MKKYLVLVVLVVVFHEISTAQNRGNCARNPRPTNQERIEQGRQNGNINRKETRILNLQRKNIHDMRNVARADGRVSRNERQLIQVEKRKLNRNIQRANNNRQN